jgi:cellulose synthase/poly-beta-1,6-N-acetylglucosamine synthase-like glycosyltransferase
MRISYTILASLCVLAPLAQAKDKPVVPGQRFVGPILNMRAPNSGGWKLLESSGDAVIFARAGALSGESFIAAVLRFRLAENQTAEEFEAFVKHGVEKDAPPDRFKSIEATFETSNERGYACVLYKATSEDMKARTSLFRRSQLILQVQALYCRLPNLEKTGFAATYSHRGPTKVEEFDAQASDFIEGVQIPHG